VTARRYRGALAALVAVRVAIPLVALAAASRDLRVFPRYERGLSGDAPGYYAAARELIAAPGRLGRPAAALLALALLALAVVLVVLLRRRRLPAWLAVLIGAAALCAASAIVITRMNPGGAAVIGWSLLWSVPMLPLRALHALDQDSAFAVGLPLQLAANAATVVATAVVGERATGRRTVGLTAAAAYALWPLLMAVVAGTRSWGNSTWNVDVGLAMYTEPISTALVTIALAIVLRDREPLPLALAGVALGLATLVKVSNGIIAAIVAVLVAVQLGGRRALPLIAGGVVFVAPLAAYWPRGYSKIEGPTAERPAFVSSVGDALHNWTDSLLFSPRALLVLVPLAALGCLAVRSRFAVALLVLPVLANAAFYTAYVYTADHPRFLFVSLPPVLVLWAAGVLVVVPRAVRRVARSGAGTMPAP
jgi:hypothetical protein